MGPIREPGSSACLHARHQRLHPCDDGSGGGRQTAPEPDSTPAGEHLGGGAGGAALRHPDRRRRAAAKAICRP